MRQHRNQHPSLSLATRLGFEECLMLGEWELKVAIDVACVAES
jgi:hypothetical protein